MKTYLYCVLNANPVEDDAIDAGVGFKVGLSQCNAGTAELVLEHGVNLLKGYKTCKLNSSPGISSTLSWLSNLSLDGAFLAGVLHVVTLFRDISF